MNYLENIRLFILQSGKKKKYLADKLHIKYDTLRRKLKGENDFTISEIINLCNLLNINIMEVFKNETN